MTLPLEVISSSTAEPNTGLFVDKRLEDAILAALKKTATDLLPEDLEGLYELKAEGLGIENLTGIERCLKLERLNLRGNQIRDLWPLATLANLKELDISNNLIRDIMPTLNLPNLEWLRISGNILGYESYVVWKSQLEARGVNVSY